MVISSPRPSSLPIPARPTRAQEDDPIGDVLDGLGPVIGGLIPPKVAGGAAQFLSAVRQPLGGEAPPVSQQEGADFVSQTVSVLVQRKAEERLGRATPEQKAKCTEAAQVALPVIQNASQDQMKAWVNNPPPEVNAFFNAYLDMGHRTPEEINKAIPHANSIPEAIELATGVKEIKGNNVTLQVNGVQAFPALKNMINGAQKSFHGITYTWHEDSTGKGVGGLVSGKVQEGLKDVKVIFDSTGQNEGAPDQPKTNLTAMYKNGVDVRQYNPLVLTDEGINLDHRKLYIADGQTAMIGGMNIGDDYAINWQDSLCTIKGPAVTQMEKEFSRDWQALGDSPIAINPATQAGNMPVQVLVTSPNEAGREKQIHVAELAAIDHVKKGQSLWLENPYFSDSELVDHLDAAISRGVSVNLILPDGNDEPLFTQINTLAAAPLKEHGANVWLVECGPKALHFNHTKLLVAEDSWSLMGSCNADPRAFQDNQELCIGVADRNLAADAKKRVFQAHLGHSNPFPDHVTPPPNASLIEYAGSIL